VVGSVRSGTTLLQRILDAHPELAVTTDADFIVRVPGVERGTDPAVTPELVDWVVARRRAPARAKPGGRLRSLELDGAVIRDAATRTATWSELVGALYDAVAERRRKPHAGQKTPVYAGHIPLLHELFPWAKVIHLLRDGRDVTLSMLDWASDGRLAHHTLWREEPVALCALRWRMRVERARRDGQALPAGSYLELGYENLVRAPEATANRLCDLLRLPFRPEMLRFHEGAHDRVRGLSAKDAWRPPTVGVRDWRADLAPRDVELFEALAGDLLTELGYPRAYDSISPEITETAERCLAIHRPRR